MLNRILSWLGFQGLSRTEGTQYPVPLSRAADSPAPVNFDTAMQLSAVWACARLLSETIAALPMNFMRQTDDGMVPDTTSDLATLFSGGKVNRYQTKVEFFETFILNLVMYGNAYALKQRVGSRLVGLLPLMSAQMETKLLNDGSVVHLYYHEEGVHTYADENIWHVKLFGNGVIGLSPLSYARNTMGIALAGETRVAKVFSNGGKPSGVLTIDHVLKDEQRNQIRKEFNELREGNSDRLMVLEAGMEYKQVSMTPQDIELLQSRRFSIEDICRFFGVPSVLVNDTSGSTTWGSGIQQIVQGFYKLNLRPYLERLEASMRANLMTAETRRRLFIEFDFDALLRANQQERFEGWQKGINAGMIAPNEARAGEGLPPLPGGDSLLINGNMVPINQAGRQPPARPQ